MNNLWKPLKGHPAEDSSAGKWAGTSIDKFQTENSKNEFFNRLPLGLGDEYGYGLGLLEGRGEGVGASCVPFAFYGT